MEYEYCAVNFRRYVYGDSVGDACSLLVSVTRNGGGGYSEDDKRKYGFRLFKFPKGCRPDRWSWYCPLWDVDHDGLKWSMLEDNMRDWEDGQLPVEFDVKKSA